MTGPVPKLWSDSTVVILAGGPSLLSQDLGPLHTRDTQVKTITVNDSWRLLPSFAITTSKPFKCGQCQGSGDGDYDLTDSGSGRRTLCDFCRGTGRCSTSAMYFCDAKWWQQSMAANRRSKDNSYSFHDAIYKGWWWTVSQDFADHPQVNMLRLTGQQGLEPEPTGLRTGSNSGYQAINLAVHLGAKKIVLLGYDMKQARGRNNWHDEPRPHASQDVYEQSMLPHFASLVDPLRELGVEVINATPDSALECFPKATLAEALL
jgi:hypothetical protein